MSTLLGDARIRIRPDLTGFHTEADRNINGALSKIGANAAKIIGGFSIAAFAKSTLDIGRTYEKSLNTLQAVSQATASQMAAVSKTAKQLGSDLTLPGTSAADAAAVMTELAKASFTVEEAQTAAKGSLQLAAAAQIDAARAATIQAAALQAFSLKASDAGRVSDVLANAANASAAEITDVSDALAQASAVAAASQISIEDTAAAIGILANNGIRGSDAGTLLKSALLALQSPSGPATHAMERLALSAYDATGNFVGLSSIFGQLSEAQKRMTPQAYAMATSTLFGSDAARLAGIAGKEGAEGFDAMAAAMAREGSAAEVAAAKSRGVNGAIEGLMSTIETFQIDVFEDAAPVLENLIEATTGLVQVFGGVIDVVSGIPAPVWAALAALTAWRLGGERIAGAFGTFRSTLKGIRDDAAVQQALYRQQASGLTALERALTGVSTGAGTAGTQLSAAQMKMRGWDVELSRTALKMDSVAASAGRMGGAVSLARAAGSSLLGVFGGPVGLAITGVTLGLSVLVPWLSKSSDATQDAKNAADEYAAALRETSGAIGENIRLSAAKAAEDSGILKTADRVGISLSTVTDAITGQGDALENTRKRLRAYIEENSFTAASEYGPVTTLNAEAEAAKAALDALNLLAKQGPETADSQERVAEAAAVTGSAIQGTAVLSEEAAQAAEDWLKRTQDALAGFVGPLSAYKDLLASKTEAERTQAEETAAATESSTDSWKDYVGDVSVSLDEYARKLQEQLDAQSNWRANIVTITGAAGLEVGQQLEAMGIEGAGLVQQMVDEIGTEQFPRLVDLMKQQSAAAGAGAALEFENAMKVMAAVGAAGGKATAYGVAQELGLGLMEVSDLARKYGITLAGGINPILSAIGKRTIAIDQQAGRTYTGVIPEFDRGGYTGDGGKYDPAGLVHKGEFVLTKEQTEAAGVQNLYAFARSLKGYYNGGFVSPASVPRPPSTYPYGVPVSTAADGVMEKGYTDVSAWVAANMEPESSSGGSATGLTAIMAAARQYVIDTYGITNIGGFANRNIAGTNVKSDHALGKAIDIMTSNKALGWAIANDFAFGEARRRFNIENTIWQQSISSRGGPFTRMADRGSITQNHYDHIHADTYDSGGILPPGLSLAVNKTGANEHQAVFTVEQWAALQQLANGGTAPLIGGDLVLAASPGSSVRDQMETAMHELRRIKRGGGIR